MSLEIGQRVRLNPLYRFTLPDLRRLQANVNVGTVYQLTNDVGVNFGVHGKWWFQEHELEVVDGD